MGVLLAVLAAFSWGLGDFLIQKSTRRFGDWIALFYITAFGGIVLFPFALKDLPLLFGQQDLLSLLLLTGLIELAAALFMFEALRAGKLSVVEPIFTIEILVTALLAGIIIREFPSSTQLLLIAVLVAGVVLVSVRSLHNLKKLSLEKGVVFVVLGAVSIGATNFLYGLGSREAGPILVNWFTSAMIAVVALVYLFIHGRAGEIRKDFQKNKTLILAVSFFDNLAWVAFSYSMTLVPIAIATGISETYVAIAASLGFLFNKERLKKHQILGLVLAIIAAAILAFEFF